MSDESARPADDTDQLRHRVVIVPFLRLIGHRLIMRDWLAITVGRWIFAWRPLDKAELAHELAHVRQWLRYGVLFIPRYLRESARAQRAGGDRYRDNVFEIEARVAEEIARREA